MSKSLGNSIALLDAPEEIYGKIMSISDALLLDYVAILPAAEGSDLRSERQAVVAGEGDPLALKHELARRVVERFHDANAGGLAADHFRRVVQERGTPSEVAEYDFSLSGEAKVSLLDLVDRLGLAASRGEVRRLVSQGAVSVDDARVTDPLMVLGAGSYLLKLGRRRFARVQIA
jgi:tyrosyl-tRNA synthetase